MAGRKRIDPVSRITDGRRQYDKIVGKVPDRAYVLANPNNEETGVPRYLSEGWTIELQRPGGPRSAAVQDAQDGAPVSRGGQVLMSRPLEDHLAEYDEGQKMVDAFERRLLKDGGIEDGLRGRGYEIGIQREEDV